ISLPPEFEQDPGNLENDQKDVKVGQSHNVVKGTGTIKGQRGEEGSKKMTNDLWEDDGSKEIMIRQRKEGEDGSKGMIKGQREKEGTKRKTKGKWGEGG